MAKGISLHIGLNSIDPAHYGTPGTLRGCENDARSMQRIAAQSGYSSTTLLTRNATSSRVLQELNRAAGSLEAGDILMVTYAGHGSQVRDLTNDEGDGKDETWCLFDRMLLDDELDAAWKNFKTGVRIVVVSDSCHSGTVTRFLPIGGEDTVIYPDVFNYRCLPPEVIDPVFFKHQHLYAGIKMALPRDLSVNDASVLLLSGCMDNQLSGDGPDNGLFTGKLLNCWGNGYKGSYKSFYQRILGTMPPTQTPNYYFTGKAFPEFEAQNAFEIEKGRGMASGLDVVGSGPNGETWRCYQWTLQVDEQLCDKFSEEELESYLRSLVKTGLMEAFTKAKKVKEEMVFPTRGGEVSIGCGASDKGWGCEVKGTIRF